MKYFVVFQGKTYKEEFKGKMLWAPTKTSNGKNALFHHENLTKCRVGDVIFSVVKNKVMARSIVVKEAVIRENPFDLKVWAKDGWFVEVDYTLVNDNIRIKDHLSDIVKFLPDKYSPFSKNTGNGTQGYLFEISNDFGLFIDDLITDQVSIIDVTTIFEIDVSDEEIMDTLLDGEGIIEANFVIIEEEPPIVSNKPKTKKSNVKYKKTDYIKKAKKDSEKGLLGEKFVELHEKNYLKSIGREDLAEQVKWVSLEADGHGYDILSFDEYGNEKYIEVKSTTLGKNYPFDISRNEVETSQKLKDNFWIYRVYNLESGSPKMYKIKGDVSEMCDLYPTSYRAYTK